MGKKASKGSRGIWVAEVKRSSGARDVFWRLANSDSSELVVDGTETEYGGTPVSEASVTVS